MLVKYRTLIGVLVAILALVGGLALLAQDARGAAYGAFATAIVGVIVALAGKGSVGVLAAGTGAKGAWKALTTDAQPSEPRPPADAGYATWKILLFVTVGVLVSLALLVLLPVLIAIADGTFTLAG